MLAAGCCLVLLLLLLACCCTSPDLKGGPSFAASGQDSSHGATVHLALRSAGLN